MILKAKGGELSFKLTTLGNLTVEVDSLDSVKPSLFIPSREAIAMYHGFVDAYDKRELSFDETYYDLCKSLSGRPAKGRTLSCRWSRTWSPTSARPSWTTP